MASKSTGPAAREASKHGTRRDKSQHKPITPQEIRKIIDRHRETFDELAK